MDPPKVKGPKDLSWAIKCLQTKDAWGGGEAFDEAILKGLHAFAIPKKQPRDQSP